MAKRSGDQKAEQDAQETIYALQLFRRDMGFYVRLYTFLPQIFDYGQTELDKQAIFFRRLIPQLDFERELTTLDTSKVQLTHHAIRNRGYAHLRLRPGIGAPLASITESGTGTVQENQNA